MITQLKEIYNILAKYKVSGLNNNDITQLNNYMKDITNNVPIISWFSYLENGLPKIVRIHNNYSDPAIFSLSNNNNLVISLNSGDYEISAENFLFFYIIPLEKTFPTPNITIPKELLLDSTERDYFSIWNSLLNILSLYSPDLVELITEKGAPDYLFLDALCFLYDRLQFYIDFASSIRNPDLAVAEYLDIISKFWGISIPSPSHSKIQIPIILSKNFIKAILQAIGKDLSSIPISYFGEFSNNTIQFNIILENYPEIFKTEIKTSKGKSYLNKSQNLIASLSGYPHKTIYIPLYYDFLENKTTIYTIDLSVDREISLTDKYIDPNSIKIKPLNISNYETYLLYNLLDYNEVLKRALKIKEEIELGLKPENYIFLPFYIETNRYGEAKITILDNLISEISALGKISFEISYSIHKGAVMNEAEYSDSEDIKIFKTDDIKDKLGNFQIIVTLSNKTYTTDLEEVLKKISTKQILMIIPYKKLDDFSDLKSLLPEINIADFQYKSFNGTDPLSDEELRAIMKIPLQSAPYTSVFSDYLKRAVNVKDYELLLYTNNIVPILNVKVKTEKILSEEIQKMLERIRSSADGMEYPYKKLTIFPYTLDIYIIGKSIKKEIKELSAGKKEEIIIISPFILNPTQALSLLKYLEKYRLPTHYIRLITDINIERKYIEGTIYSPDVNKTTLDLYKAQNAILLATEIEEKPIFEKIANILFKYLSDCILDINLATVLANINVKQKSFIWIDIISKIKISDITQKR